MKFNKVLVLLGTLPLSLTLGCGGGGAPNISMRTPTTAAPLITTQPKQEKALIAGEPVTLWVTASGNPAPTFIWQRLPQGKMDWETIENATLAQYGFSSKASDNGAQFRVEAINELGTAISQVVALTVNPVPGTPAFTLDPQDQNVAAGDTVTFTASASSDPAPTYTWQCSTNSGSTWTPIGGATTSTYSFTTKPSDSGAWYRATATNGNGSATSGSAKLTVTTASSHLAAYFPFSGNMDDQGPNHLPTVNHGVTLTADRFGNPNSAYYFNGSSYIDIQKASLLNGMKNFTLSAWIKTDVQDQGVILSKVNPNRDFVM